MGMRGVPHDGRYAVYFSEFAVKCISPTDSPDESITSLFSFNGVTTSPEANETSPEMVENSPGPVKSQDERVKLLRERGEVLINIKQSLQMVDSHTQKGNFTPEELYEQVAENGITEDQVLKWIEV